MPEVDADGVEMHRPSFEFEGKVFGYCVAFKDPHVADSVMKELEKQASAYIQDLLQRAFVEAPKEIVLEKSPPFVRFEICACERPECENKFRRVRKSQKYCSTNCRVLAWQRKTDYNKCVSRSIPSVHEL